MSVKVLCEFCDVRHLGLHSKRAVESDDLAVQHRIFNNGLNELSVLGGIA